MSCINCRCIACESERTTRYNQATANANRYSATLSAAIAPGASFSYSPLLSTGALPDTRIEALERRIGELEQNTRSKRRFT